MRPRKRILLIEADERERNIRSFILESCYTYRVFCAENSAQAIEIAGREQIDVVLCDLVLGDEGGNSGNTLVGRLKALLPEVPSILFSATVDNYDRASNADRFIPPALLGTAYLLHMIYVTSARKRGPKSAAAKAAKAAA